MNQPLPLNARRIGVEWPIPEGGIGATARTDDAGQPYIGLYPLCPKGQPACQPIEFPRSRLMIDVVVGYDRGLEIVVFIDAEITSWGLNLRVVVPTHIGFLRTRRRLSARWGSPSPQFHNCPTTADWLVFPFSKKDEPEGDDT
jgi:hypothetical protein